MQTKKNLYFRQVIKRLNKLKAFILNFFVGIASYPRLLLEVFIRKDFGQRYFSMASAVTVAIILLALPYASGNVLSLFQPSRYMGYGHGGHSNDGGDFWWKYATWYLFIAAFLFFSYRRWQEVKRNPSVFDFAKYSLSSGFIHQAFYDFRFFGKKFNTRTIEIFLEPAAFFVLGFILYQFGQNVGMLLMICSILYSLGYAGAYKMGDDFIMDQIDEMLMNEQLENAFVNDLNPDQTKGVRFMMDKPTSTEIRQKVSMSFLVDDLDDVAIAK